MKYYVRLGQQEHVVDVKQEGGRIELVAGGRTERLDLATVDEGRQYSALLGSRSFALSVDGDGRDLCLVIDGRAYHVAVENERERAVREISPGGGAAGGAVVSVMPGIVRRIEVAPGATVAAGDRLLILEAMKMENEIRADGEGVVEEIRVQEGQAVEGGQILLVLRAAAGGQGGPPRA